ncbi:urease accessory protein UreD [Kitasatospora sp. NBC_01287]|uniref:urease accessory protein UreD n=1 Tax=Kitasatospora sp. NBC_01287 TaxID=2903573 RepID=UPI0022577B63|nr:urease accessory protein UreD [Kitasatospora sp. NBC_01287]MCX4751489.1 urease accessory protein UreD [Kitasatospora sp. NBC_01287]
MGTAPAVAPPPPEAVPTARIHAVCDERGRTALPALVGAGPLALRRLRTGGPAAEVALIGAMAAPLGGDRLAVRVRVGPGARLRVTSVAATVSLPGDGPAHWTLDLDVAAGGLLEWLPEPVVAAAGSHLVQHTRIRLAAGAALRLREELVLGRHHDWAAHGVPGRVTSRLTVRQDGRLVLDQQTDLGPGAPAWDGPAALGPHRTAGHLLTVGLPAPEPAPASASEPAPAPEPARPSPPPGECALLALPGTAAHLLVALAPDALVLRQLLGA